MKVKKILSMFLVEAVFLANGVCAFASTDIPVDGNTTGQTETRFEVTSEMLGENVLVSIPAEMTLTWNKTNSTLEAKDYVSAKGKLFDNKHLEITTADSVTYKKVNAPTVEVQGTITWGIVTNHTGVENWTATELESTPITKKSIGAVVNLSDVSSIGDYSANIVYTIKIVNP